MPGEISKETCDTLERGIKDLEEEWKLLWEEFIEVWNRYSQLDAELAAAQERHDVAMLEWITVTDLLQVAQAQLRRCQERGADADCTEEAARVAELESRLVEVNAEIATVREWLAEIRASRPILEQQVEQIRASMWSNGEKIEVREIKMKSGHCFRFKRN